MTNSTAGEFASLGIRANEKGKERVRQGKDIKGVVGSGSLRKRYRGGKGSQGEGCGHGTRIADGRGQ